MLPPPDVDCPARHRQAADYPVEFAGRVPLRVRMRRMVTADPMPAVILRQQGKAPPVAIAGAVYLAWTNSYGAVAAVFDDGERLGLKPDEFDVVEWWAPTA